MSEEKKRNERQLLKEYKKLLTKKDSEKCKMSAKRQEK